MRYIYIVTRLDDSCGHIRTIPNLGVHTSFKRALKHYNAVLENREENGNVIWKDNIVKSGIACKYDILRSFCVEKGQTKEEVRIEKWRL